jgi:hypothetical protein
MISKLKALSLALGAVFAMGAVMASTASAVDVFTNSLGKGTDILTGVGSDHVFKIAGGAASFECKTARFAATATHGDTSITVDPEYFGTPKVEKHGATEHCNGNPGGHKVVVDMNGCTYNLSGKTVATKDGTDAEVWITCPPEKEITVTDTTVGITIHVHPQTPTTEGGATYTNLPTHTGGEAIEVTATVTGITYTCTPTFTCGLGGIPSEANDGQYTGHVKITCYKDENKVGDPITPAKEGAQTGCKISSV